MYGDLMGDLIHSHDIFALHVFPTCEAEIALEGPRQIVILDVLCRADHCIHENQEVVGAVVTLLKLQEENHEGLLQAHHMTSFLFAPPAPLSTGASSDKSQKP